MNRQESFAGRLDREYQKPISCPRPASLKEFVGQEHAKRLITTSAASAKRRNAPFPHTLITGFAGGGKTTLACLIARYMDVSFVPVTADAIADTAAVGELMASLDDTGYDREGNPSGTIRPTVLFLDEAHRLPRQSQELLYACIEDRVLNVRTRDPLTGVTRSVRQWVPFFSLVAATNRPVQGPVAAAPPTSAIRAGGIRPDRARDHGTHGHRMRSQGCMDDCAAESERPAPDRVPLRTDSRFRRCEGPSTGVPSGLHASF
jgi:hypothetical protein